MGWIVGAGLVALSGSLILPVQAASTTLRISRTDWKPYIYPNGQRMAGLDVELMDAIVKEAGLQLAWVEDLPKRRRRMLLEAGELELIPAATPTDAGHQVAHFSDSYRMQTMAVMALGHVLPSLPAISHYEHLISTRTRLLAPRSRGLDDVFEQWRSPLEAAGLLEYFDKHMLGMEMLLRGRAPLILGDRPTLWAEATRRGLSLVALNVPRQDHPVSLMLSRRSVSEATVQRINSAIQRLEKNGTLPRIRQQYGLEAQLQPLRRQVSAA